MRKIDTFYIRTYGCQMNELDSEIIVGILERRGLVRSHDENIADLLIFNTCSIRDLAERKVMGKLGQLGITRKDRPIFGIAGCMANAKKEELFKKLPHIDFLIGPNNIHELDDVLDTVLSDPKKIARTDEQFHRDPDYSLASRDDHLKAYVSIIRGCDKFCSYCIVPYTRGREVSRPPDDIVEECRSLAAKGYREITLLGQNVNSYGKDKTEWGLRFHDLLYRLDNIKGLERIRFMTSHPVDITRGLMEAIRDIPSVCEFIHFPIQSGSDRILKKMNRKYTAEDYLNKVHMLKELVPGVALGTDIIVGFPTESDDDFAATYRILEEIGYSTAFLFAYSSRKGTVAARWQDDVSEEIKGERLHKLLALQDTIYEKYNKTMCNTTVEVLVERINNRDDSQIKGRTRHWKNVLFSGDKSLIGTLQQVKIKSYKHQTLLGEL